MKKKILSLFLLVCLIFGCLSACATTPEVEETVDYVASVSLDLESKETIKKQVTMKTHVDGDTTHFFLPENDPELPEELKKSGFVKARYLAVNTPESTGTIEEWGKKASKFTKDALRGAESIYIETDKNQWEHDNNGRYLLWVWYKAPNSETYRNLNIELLQNGLAVGNKTSDSRYGEICTKAITQAKAQKLCVYSGEKDPEYYYEEAVSVNLKELRLNIDSYSGKRVAFEATAAVYNNWSIYLEEFDEATGLYFGIPAFYGYHHNYHEILKPGTRVYVVGEVSYYEAGDSYQLTDLRYDRMDKNNPDNIKNLGVEQPAAYALIDVPTFNGKTTIDEKEYENANLMLGSTVSLNGLKVKSTYTTNNGGDNDGAITITCEDANQNEIVIRTAVLKFPETLSEEYKKDTVVPAKYFTGKTINVKGVVEVFSGEYQVKVFMLKDITFAE